MNVEVWWAVAAVGIAVLGGVFGGYCWGYSNRGRHWK